jgi:signal peptidase
MTSANDYATLVFVEGEAAPGSGETGDDVKRMRQEAMNTFSFPYEDFPDDDALLDELIDLVNKATQDDDYVLSGQWLPKAPPARENPPKASWKSFASTVLFYLVLIAAVLATLVFTNSRGGAPRDIFGYSYFTVLTTSMQSVLPKGSIVVTKNIPEKEIQIGDDITFFKDENVTVTHRVIEIRENYLDGKRGFVTKGVDNRDPDTDIVTAQNIVGVVKLSVPKLGAVLSLVKENLLLTAVMFGLIVLISVCAKIFFTGGKQKSKKNPPRRKAKLAMV